MSFASQVKEELCNIQDLKSHCKMALLESLLRLNSEVEMSNGLVIINFTSANLKVSKLFTDLVEEFYSCETEFIEKQTTYFNKANYYIVRILTQTDVIIEEFSLLKSQSLNKDDIVNNPCCTASYLRGTFIAKGSVNEPNASSYHLEISAMSETEAIFIQRLMNAYDLNAKITKRRNDLVIYIKDIEMIIDFLRIIGTIKAVFEVEEVVIQRGFNAGIRRVMNCEIANEEKTLSAAKEQIKQIQYLEYNYPLEKLDNKILMIMKVRKDNPEASFNELLTIIEEKFGEKITKSGLNHRFRKIKEIVNEHKSSRQKE